MMRLPGLWDNVENSHRSCNLEEAQEEFQGANRSALWSNQLKILKMSRIFWLCWPQSAGN